jgi:hypothetical protein
MPAERAASAQSGVGPPRPLRRNIGLSVSVHVLVEEETFSPFQFEGECQEISRSGALIAIRDLTKEAYVKMIQHPRYVRAVCQLPETEQPVTLFGKLVGFDFKEEGGSSICRLAMAFEPMKEEVVTALDRFLVSRQAGGAGG